MQSNALSQELISRFRAVSLERLERVELAWSRAMQEPGKLRVSTDILRDLHTLKGDARAVGFADVNMLAHRLEDLISVAFERGPELPQDYDLVVTMGLRFAGVLVRKRAGGAMRGIDLDGFIRQVDDVLDEARQRPCARGRAQNDADARGRESTDHVAPETVHRLAAVATSVWLEWCAGGGSSARLRTAWDELRAQAARLRAVPLAGRLGRHAQAIGELAIELGKRVELRLELGEAQVAPQVAEAVDVAVMHALRNAVDHGVESPERRRVAGKPAEATICVVCTSEAVGDGDELCVTIADDGAGVDFERVRARAVELGWLDPVRAEAYEPDDLMALLFAPGFSTRHEVTSLSGRGMGLDTVRAGLERLGGKITLASERGRGTKVALRVRHESATMDVRRVSVGGARGAPGWAIPAMWAVAAEPEVPGTARWASLDPRVLLGLAGPLAPGEARAVRVVSGVHELRLRVARAALALGQVERAERVCPTAESEPCEVLKLDGEELLLLRPDVLADLSGVVQEVV
jgi:two-component system chemotaxis sensor kinase CheA